MTDQHHPGQPGQNGPQNQPPLQYEPQQPQGQPGQPFETGQFPPGPQPVPARRSRRQRGRGPKIVGAIVYSLVVLLVGVVIGSATASKTGTPAAASTPATSATTSPSAAPASTTSSAPAAAAPTTHVLIRFTGSGIKNSAPFNVGSGPLTITYHFNCAAFGGSGNFAADLLYGNQSSLNSDDQSIANDLAPSGSQTTTVYPQDPGKDYYLSVDSECSWRLKVVSG
jgi:hypothetical protein